ncbi:MAG: molybdopterin-dependent oxidoreductase [Acidimicrobiales bacterium]
MVDEIVGACPLDCPDACSWIVTVDGGQAVRMRPRRDHPFTRGALCVKVNSYLDHVRHPDRLLYPQRRVGPKGSGRFERVSWDEALAEMADRMTEAIERHGAETIWPYAGTGSVGWIQGVVGAGKRLFHHLGASRHAPTICSVAGHAGMGYSMGTACGMDPEDLRHSGLVLLWGTNTLTSNQHLRPFLEQARARGAPIWCIDPVRTRTAAWADEHIALRPGTDAALALGVMAELVALGAHDRDYLDAHTLGWGDFEASLAGWSAERSADVCGLDAAVVRRLTRDIADRRPTAIRCSMGMQRHAGGGQAVRVLSCLPALTGDHTRLGGGITYSTSPAYGLDRTRLTRPDLAPRPTRSLAMTRLGNGLLDLDDPPVSVLVLWGANPVVSNPDTGRVRRGLERDDLFTVVIEHFLTDTARYADLVLPSTMQIEHLDMHDSFSHLYLNWNEPAVEAAGECLPHTEIFRRLAAALGVDDPAVMASDLELAADVLGDDPSLAGITVEQLRRHGFARLSLPVPYLPLAEVFPTPSGRFEFVSSRAAADGHRPMPHYRPPSEAADPGPDAVALVTPAAHHFLNSVFANRQRHRDRAGPPTVLVHPDDAERFGVVDGGGVLIHNRRGRFAARARVTDAVRPGVVAGTKGHWLGEGGGVNSVVAERDSDMGRGAVYHDVSVRLAAVDRRRPDGTTVRAD